jgi:hypothetical protein
VRGEVKSLNDRNSPPQPRTVLSYSDRLGPE